jgi:hypothetical protein
MRQPGIDAGLFLCNAKGTSGEPGALITELQMETFDLRFDRANLCPWYFAVGWARLRVQQSVHQARKYGWNNNYEEIQLQRLIELEQFIKMTWDQVLDGDLPTQTAQEVK